MIPNIDSKPTTKPFKDVSDIFITVSFNGEYLTWVKIPEVREQGKTWNAYCFEQKCLDYFDECFCVTDPKNVDMKVEF